AEPILQLDLGDDLGREALREVDGLADVVGVAVGQGDDVHPLGLLLAVRALGIGEKGIDVDALAAGGVEAKRGVAEPRESDVWHAPEVNVQEAPLAVPASGRAGCPCVRMKRTVAAPEVSNRDACTTGLSSQMDCFGY